MESTLSLQLADFAREVGSYLGFGRTPANWTGWQAATPYVASSEDTNLGWIMSSVQSGLRQFYFPTQTGLAGLAHKWSFLSPQRQMTVVAGQNTYDLEDDVYYIQGDLTYQPSVATAMIVQNLGIGRVKQQLQVMNQLTGKPSLCAIYPKPTDGVGGQRFAIVFAPTPDSTYTFDYTCDVFPGALSATRPFPYGGSAHGETILYSMLAVAEERFMDEQTVRRAAYQERLQASISADVRDFQPDKLGYCGDRSDRMGRNYALWRDGTYGGEHVTFNGVLYSLLLVFGLFVAQGA